MLPEAFPHSASVQPVSWTSTAPQAAPRTPNVPWLGEEGEMREIQPGWMGTAFHLEEMRVKEREQRQGKN